MARKSFQTDSTDNCDADTGKSKTVLRLINRNPDLDFMRTLYDVDETTLSYVAHGDALWLSELKRATCENLENYRVEGKLENVSIRAHLNPAWESSADDASINMPLIKKDLKIVASEKCNTIVRLAWVYACEEGTWRVILVPMLIVLSFIIKDDHGNAGTMYMPRKSSTMPHRVRPEFEEMTFSEATSADIQLVAEHFVLAESRLRTAAKAMLEGQEKEGVAWKASAYQRSLGAAQIGSLLKAEKTIFGTGLGQEVIGEARVKPFLRPKSTKREKPLIDHDVVLNLLWKNAFENAAAGMFRVPYVKQ